MKLKKISQEIVDTMIEETPFMRISENLISLQSKDQTNKKNAHNDLCMKK